MTKEPVVIGGSILAVLQTVLALVISFGADLTDGQVAAIMGAAGAFIALITALVVRAKVTPT